MLLHSVEIQGFKGIKNLTITLNRDLSVLIGENSWGSSSLIAALSIITKDNFLYECQEYDFFDTSDYCNNCLQLRFTYVENTLLNNENIQNIPALKDVSYFSNQLQQHVICYQVSSSRHDNRITTEHHFIDGNEKKIEAHDFEEKLRYLIDLNPLVILRGNAVTNIAAENENVKIKEFRNLLIKQLSKDSQQLTNEELEQGLYAATLLLTYYLASNQRYEEYIKKPTLEDWQVLDKINDLLDQLDNSITRNVLMDFFTSVIFHGRGYSLNNDALPILFLTNFGGNTHPIITSVGMRLLKHIPAQKILTSNTSDLIPMLSLQNVMRISRSNSNIVINQVMEKELSANTNRKVLFHIFHRRPIALYSRCWFLVEGETEIWLLRELAEICGYNLDAEGVTLIEFAQCGVLALIEYAEAMGINWYVMTDGDAAGRNYARIVRSHCKDKETYYQHITQLPARDIENFLFKRGFSSVYKTIAYGSSEFVNVPVPQIIQKAIQKSSKPDLALAVCDYARTHGTQSIPNLLQRTFEKVMSLSKG